MKATHDNEMMVFHNMHETGLSIAATSFWCHSYIVE